MTRATDYGAIAGTYDLRYQNRRYEGIESVVRDFVRSGQRVLEVGCGTGHWLSVMEQIGCEVVGVDPSAEMLMRARALGLNGALVSASAECLPFADASFDRLLCINAIHHFKDIPRFLGEARRVLRAGGRFVSICLDPSEGRDRWAIYEYFTPTLELDRARYPKTPELRAALARAGFVACETVEAEHISSRTVASEALEGGQLDKHVTSQLAILTDEEYGAGIARIRDAIRTAEARDEVLELLIDLHLYATLAEVP